jgi:hypothetical protein
MKIIIIFLIISLYYVIAFTPAERAVAWAKLQQGKGYSQAQCGNGVSCCRYGPNCYDCSGFVASAWGVGGVQGLPPTTRSYPNKLVKEVFKGSLEIGDIVWKQGHVQLISKVGEDGSEAEICEAANEEIGCRCGDQWYDGVRKYYRPVIESNEQTPSNNDEEKPSTPSKKPSKKPTTKPSKKPTKSTKKK